MSLCSSCRRDNPDYRTTCWSCGEWIPSALVGSDAAPEPSSAASAPDSQPEAPAAFVQMDTAGDDAPADSLRLE